MCVCAWVRDRRGQTVRKTETHRHTERETHLKICPGGVGRQSWQECEWLCACCVFVACICCAYTHNIVKYISMGHQTHATRAHASHRHTLAHKQHCTPQLIKQTIQNTSKTNNNKTENKKKCTANEDFVAALIIGVVVGLGRRGSGVGGAVVVIAQFRGVVVDRSTHRPAEGREELVLLMLLVLLLLLHVTALPGGAVWAVGVVVVVVRVVLLVHASPTMPRRLSTVPWRSDWPAPVILYCIEFRHSD